MPDFSSFRPAPKTRRTPNLYAPQQQPQGYSDREVDMWNAQRGMAVMQENIARAGGGVPTTRRTGSSSTSQPGVISAGEKVTRVQRGDGSIIPVAAVTGDSHLIRPKGSSNIYVSPSTGERFKPDPASPMGLSSIGTARAEAMAKQAEKDAKLAAKQAVADDKEAIRQENDRREAAFAAEGRPSYTDAHGRIQPKQSDEAWEATKKQKQAGKQQANEYLKDGRRFYTDKITGLPVPMTSDEEHARNKADKLAKIQKDAAERPHKQRLDVLKAELSNPDLKVSDKDLKDADEALTAASAPLMALRGNDDFATPISDDEVKAMLKDADPAKKAAANAYLNARENVGKLAKAEAQRKALEQEVYKTNLRIADPGKYAEELKAEAPAKSAEDLKAHAAEIEERIKARAAEHKAETDRIKAKDDELSAQHALTKERYDQALAKGEAPAVIGTLGDSLNDLEEQMTQWESESQDQRAAVNAQADEINKDAANLKILGDEEKRRADEQQKQHVEQLDAALPGAGKRYGDAMADVQKRAQDLQAKYPDPFAPEAKAAFDALQKDFEEKTGAITREVELKSTERSDNLRAARIALDREAKLPPAANDEEARKRFDGLLEKVGLDPKNQDHKDAYLDANALKHLEEPTKAAWEPGDKIKKGFGSAVLSDGSLHIAPEFIPDAAKYAAVVEASDSTPAEKAKAMSALPKLQLAFAESALPALKAAGSTRAAKWIPGIPSFQKWQAEKKREGSEVEQASEYLTEMGKRGELSKITDNVLRSTLAGFADIGTMTAGVAGMAGLQGASELAADWSQQTNRFTAPISMEGGDKGIGSAILGQTARMAGPMAAQLLITRGLGGGMASMAALAAGQTAGSQYAESYGKLRESGMTHKEAWKRAAPFALASGAVTAMIDAAGGRTGFAAALGQKAGSKAALEAAKHAADGYWKNLARNVPREALAEIPKEFPDEMFSQISQALAEDPNADISQVVGNFMANAPAFLGAVALMGGSGGLMETNQEFKKKASDQPPAPDLGPAPTPSILPEQAAANAAAIDNWTPTGSLPSSIQDAAKAAHGKAPTPEQHADTARTAAHALVEIAAGQDPRTMSPEVRRALGIKTNSKTGAIEPLSKNVTPLVDSVADEKGNHQPVITDAARSWLAQEVPGAGEAVKLSYSERVDQIKNPPKPAKKPVAKKAPKEKTPEARQPGVEGVIGDEQSPPAMQESTGGQSGEQSRDVASSSLAPAPKLPRELASAKPAYSYGEKQFKLEFENDVDRAAYIAAKEKPSKRDADFVAFVMKHTGMNEAAVRAHGAAVRAYIKPYAAEGKHEGTILIPSQRNTGSKKPAQASAAKPAEAKAANEQEDTTIAAETDASLQARTAGPDRTAYTQAISDRRAAAERLVLTIKKGDKIVLSDGEEMVAEKDAIQKTGEVQFVGNSTPVAAAPFLMRDRATLPSGEVVELPAGKIVRAKDSGSQQKPQPAEQEKAPRGTNKPAATAPDDRRDAAQGLAGGALLAAAEKQSQAVVSKMQGEEKQRAIIARDIILAVIRRYNGHLPIDLATGDNGFSFNGTVLINPRKAIMDVVDATSTNAEAKAMAETLFDHEVIHLFAVSQIAAERVKSVWDDLPADVQEATIEAYSIRRVAFGQPAIKLDSFTGGHEYFRAMYEATRKGIISEQTISPKLAEKWKQLVLDFLAKLKDLKKQFASIKSEAKRAELTARVQTILNEVQAAKDAFERSITLESNSPGKEPAQAASTGAVSTTGTSSESPVKGSTETVAAADGAGSITNENESSVKSEREDGLAAPTLADNDHYLFHSKPGDIAATPDGGNIFIVGHFTKQKDANAVKAQFDSVRPGTAKVTPWLAKPKREGGKTVSMWAVTIANVSQSFADQITSMRQENGLGKTTAERQVDQTVTDNSVTDHPQQAIIKGDTITIRMKVDKQIMAAYSFPLAEWLAAEKGPSANPNWNRREIIKKHTEKFKLDDQDGGPSQADRIRDAQGYAIQKALAAHAKATEVSNDTKSPAITPPEIKEAAPSLKSEGKFSADDKAEFASLADGLFQPPSAEVTYKAPIPPAKLGGFITLATKLAEREGEQRVDSPEKVAAFIDEALPGGKARALSDAFWSAIRMTNPALPAGEVDWSAIYAPVDNPASDATITNESDMVQRPGSAESGDAGSTGGTITEGSADSGRVGSDESSTPTQDGEGENAAAESAGGAEPTSAGPGTSGSGRDDASIGPRDSGDVRSEHATVNYSITDADKIGEGGLKTKYADNVAAIKLVKELQAAGRKPTAAEQKILVRYVGWGGLKGVFDPTNKTWKDQHAEIKGLLTEDEYAAAKRSRLDAHFTSPTVIKNGIWGALRRFGFTGGKMLEGGVGIGHMIGLMPASVRPASSYLGIEKDPITAQIAAYLYPEASIHNAGFEKATVERDHFDAAAGNPPFGQQQLYDPLFKAASKFSIHNYFIAKHIEALRPGGVGAWVVSHNFLDALDPAAREYIASKAEFLGAIRLPNTAFKGNANTEVTTDIVYFRRVADGTETNTDWTKATKQSDKDGNAYSLNEWINNHRDMILGTLDTTGSMYGPGELTVTAPPAQDLAQDIAAAVENLPADVYDNGTWDANIRLATPEYIPVPNEVRVGAYFIGEKGELRRRLSDANMERRSAPADVAEGTAERIRGMVEVRDAFNKVVSAELDNNATPAALDSLRAELNRIYDTFVKKHGLLHQTGNRRAFFSDPHAARILGLESDYDSGVSAATAKKNSVPVRKPTAKKADIFNRRVNSPYSEITKVETSKEALTVALNQRGTVDLDYMTQLSGIDRDTLLRELDGLIFETPQGEWQVASQYLSGNVRKKFHDAEAAAQNDPRFAANVEALKAVQPPDLEATQVTVTPGAPWVMSDVLKQFAKDLTGEDATSAVYNSANGGWIFNHPSNGTNSTQVWGTPKADFGTLFANILNNKPTIIHLPRGKDDPLVVDAHSTALAQAKSDAIREKWATWVWEDQARRESLLRIYNDKYNVYVDPKYDGSHLTLPGISNVVTLRPHQKDVVWRIMTDLTTLLDHVVGAGKTFAGVAAFMELRRLGRVRKPMFAVPNHLVTQWRDDFVKLYPNANVLFARPSDFKKGKRQQLFAKIMTGEYDAVIVGHSSLKKIGMSPQVEGELLREMLKEITDTLAAVAEAEGKRGSRAQTQLERQKEALEAKLARLADIGGADEVATFEELGIDGLFVDEAHEFKNLFYTTQMQNVAGLGNPAGSGKAFDLYLKTRHLRKRYGGKAPVVFATGTPISNSLVEMFTMQRYLQPEVLESMGITTLDAWAKVFATVKQVYEVNPTGTGMRLATRLAQFQNVGDLSAVYRTVADVITMSDLHAQAEAQGKKFPIPKVKGGKPKIYAVDRTPEQESYFGVETQRTTASGEPIYDGEGNPIFEYPEGSINWRVDNMPDDPREDNMLKLTSDARKAALDMRLVNPDAADRPESKINTTVRNILATAKEWDAEKGTQLVFCDLSVPSSARGKAKAKALEAISAISWVRFHDKIVRVENVTPVTIPGFEEFEFFVRKDGKEWSVNERSSGVRVSSGSSKAKAVANAASRVMPMGVDKFRTAIESHKPSTEDLAAFFASQEEAPAKEADTEEADVADDTETTVSMDELLAEESSFSVYDDLKAKLIAGGLLPNQVEFIHDHDSPEKKSILFARMNKGDVRVLIGSTPKLGAGTNVQRKLVALHHMDAPWRPSDLEQREGRIIRQGNEFYEADPEGFEVSINRYATKMTYDTRMWQIIEHKAAGIEGFRRAERTTRVLEDVSGEAANAAEMKAASSGDPRIAREIMLRGEIMKLQNLFDGWRQNRWRTESRVNALGDHPNTHASLKKNRLELIAKRDAATTEEFSYQLPGGNKVDKKADILAPIAEIIKAAPDGERIAIGRYRGFMFAVTRRKARGGDYYFEIEAAPIGANSTQYRGVSYLYKSDDLSATGLIQRFDNYLSGFEGDITRDAEGVIRSLKERDELQATLKDTFKDEAKLEEMKAEHATLRAELMQSRAKRAAAPAPDEALKAPPAGRYEPTTRAAIGQTIRRFEQAWKPFFTYSDDTAPKEKRKNALRKIIDQFATLENSALWKQFAELPTEGLVPEDAERVAEAKELLPYLEGQALGAPPSGYKTPDSMLAATKATMQGMNKPTAPAFQSKDLHAAYQRAIRGTSTASTSIRSVFDAAKKDHPSLSADEFKAQVKADYYVGLVGLEPADSASTTEKAGQFTMRDSLGVVNTNMVFMPTTEAEMIDAAERDTTTTPDQILSDWAGTGEALGQNPTAQDAEYMAAVESGDVAKQQAMVDLAAKAAGYTVGPVWHGTEQKGLTEFYGGWWSDNRKVTREFGSQRYAAYLKGPLADGDMLRQLYKEYNGTDIDPDSEEPLYDSEIADDAMAGSQFQDLVRSKGFQGIEVWDESNAELGMAYAVFEPNQIKSADPITRDAEGNVIPLSKRFNHESNSILFQNPAPIDPTVANQGDTDENREAFARARGSYITNELTKANFEEIRQKVEEHIDEDEQGMLDNIQYKVANDEELSLEEEIARRMLANTLRTRGVRENDQAMVTLADSLWGQDIRDATETARKLAVRVDQFQSPQERLDAAMGRIIAPNRANLRERLTNVWTPSAKRREIARLEGEIAKAATAASRASLERTLAEAKARMDQNDLIDKMAAENREAVDKVLTRLGLTQADLSMTPDDRHSLQVGIMDSSTVKAHMVNLSPEVQKAIEMSVRGYADAAIVRDTGLSNEVVGRVTEHFRNEVAKKAVSQMVKVGKHTMGSIIEGGKNFLKWILGAPPAPLQNMVNTGVKNAANVQAQVQAILNAAIPTRRNRNRRALHAAVVNGKKGQKITVFVPYDPTDWQQVYRVARELSTREATAMSKIYEYWINGILSGPQTHVVNTASNVLSTLWHYLPQFFASATVNSVIRDPNSTQWGEWPRVWAGFMKGIKPAMENFALAWRTEADPIEYQYLDRPVTVMFNDAAMEKAGGGRSPAIGGPVGRVIRIPGRFLVAMDAFAKTLIMHGEVSAQAYRLGKKRGLSGVALENFMASQIAVHGSESWEGALQTAKELTFQDENDITKTVEKLANAAKQAKYVGLLAKFLFPFIRTPTNIYRAGMRKAGGSAGILLWKLGQAGFYKMKEGRPFFDTYAKGKMVQDVSESVMAGILWFGLMAIAEGDPEDEDRWITMTGTRPYGIANAGERTAQLEGEGGSNLIIIRKNPVTGAKLDKPIRIAYGRYEPLALTMGSIIDAAREFKEWTRLPAGDQTAGKLAGTIASHLASQAQDKTFLQGVSGIMDFFDKLTSGRYEPGQEAAKFLINGAIPNLIRQPLKMSGPEILDSHKAHEILGSANIGNALADGEAKITTAGKPVTRAGNQYLNVLFPGTTEPGKATFYAALKDWNTRHPGEKWNPDPITKGDWYIYDPAKGGTKGKFPLKDVRQISLFEKMVGNLFASKSAIALGKLGYRPGIKATPDMIDAIKKSHTDAIKQVRSMPPSAFIVKAKP